MSKIAVVIDSTAGMPAELVEKYNIHVIPQILNWDGESLRDGIHITADAFYSRLATAAEMPTTSQPSAGEFADFFKEVSKSADQILAILISDELSGTLGSARTAAGMLKDTQIEIVDSRSTSMGLGWIALAAAKAVSEGASLAEAAQLARDLVAKVRVVFVVDTLKFLHKGGRIGGAKRLMGSVLSIKPLLHLENGKIEPLASVRTHKKALGEMLNVIDTEINGRAGTVRMAVINAKAEDTAKEIGEQLKARFSPVEFVVSDLSPIVGAHVGPGTVGVAWMVED